MQIIIKDHSGFNRGMGKYIRSNSHYKEEMKRNGFVSAEQGSEIARKNKDNSRKNYSLSNEANEMIKEAHRQVATHGKISDNLQRAINEKKGDHKIPKNEMKNIKSQGGFGDYRV